MAFLEWTRALEFGIPVIDDQHKRIVEFINELDDAVRTGNEAETQHVMEGLLNYTVTHFEFEEDLQERANYPYLKAHRRLHEILMKKVAAIRERSQQGEDVAPELLTMLKGWLANHINSEDRDYVESIQQLLGTEDHDDGGWLSTWLKKFVG